MTCTFTIDVSVYVYCLSCVFFYMDFYVAVINPYKHYVHVQPQYGIINELMLAMGDFGSFTMRIE